MDEAFLNAAMMQMGQDGVVSIKVRPMSMLTERLYMFYIRHSSRWHVPCDPSVLD